MSQYLVLAYYYFTPVEDPHLEVKRHKEFFKDRDITCRIYIGFEGINGQLSGSREACEEYMAWMQQDPRFEFMPFKIHSYHENCFPRQTVKFREQLCALDEQLDTKEGGYHASPAEWKQMLEDDEEKVIIDVRNDYEWEVGHFKGAELPKYRTFREFREYADGLKKNMSNKKTRVMMYCTGGIRCELYSALLKKKGFENVVQLDGGIINYGLKEGNEHWDGKLFVFDDRLTVPISDDEHSTIGKCHHCGQSSDRFLNCANMDCNDLMVCCQACEETLNGCCSKECTEAPRVRSRDKREKNKPFRRMSTFA